MIVFLIVVSFVGFNCLAMEEKAAVSSHSMAYAKHILEIYKASDLICDNDTTCAVCKKSKQRSEHLSWHLHNSSKYYCKRCGFGYVQNSNYRSHLRSSVHESSSISIHCSLCGDSTVNKDRHIKFHEDELCRWLAGVGEKPDWKDLRI